MGGLETSTSSQATPLPQTSTKDIQQLKDALGDLTTRMTKMEQKTTSPQTAPQLPKDIVTKDNFKDTFKDAATDTSVSQAWSTGSKVSNAVTEWMNVPDNQTKIKNMVQDGTGYATKADLTALQQKVDGLDAGGSGDASSSGSSGSGLTFSALKMVGCTRWNWFHDSNRKICYAKNCDPQSTYKDGRCFSDRSNCTDAKAEIVVLADGTCQAALGPVCKAPAGATCKAECSAGDDQIQMPTECSGPLILRDIYGNIPGSTPTPLVQKGAFPELNVGKLQADTVEVLDEFLMYSGGYSNMSVTMDGDDTVMKLGGGKNTLKVRGNIDVEGGNLTGDGSVSIPTLTVGLVDTSTNKSTGNLVVNGNVSAKCPACCLTHIATDCPLAYPYAYAKDSKQGSACCSKPAGGGAEGKQPTTCSGDSIACPKKGGNCTALQVGNKNPCPDCATCGKLTLDGNFTGKTNAVIQSDLKGHNVHGDTLVIEGESHFEDDVHTHGLYPTSVNANCFRNPKYKSEGCYAPVPGSYQSVKWECVTGSAQGGCY